MLGGLSKDRKNITLVSRGVVLDHIRNSVLIFFHCTVLPEYWHDTVGVPYRYLAERDLASLG